MLMNRRQILSAREIEVLAFAAGGCGNKDIGRALFISSETVKNHLATIMGKLDATSRTSAAVTALRLGLIT